MYDAYNSVVSWMIAGGARIDEPDTRYLEHERALREAKRSAGGPSPRSPGSASILARRRQRAFVIR